VNLITQAPFASRVTADFPLCDMCTWVWRATDNLFHLKYVNNWCSSTHRGSS
jgi:hypothetical protein